MKIVKFKENVSSSFYLEDNLTAWSNSTITYLSLLGAYATLNV